MIVLSFIAAGVAAVAVMGVAIEWLVPQMRHAHPLSPAVAWFWVAATLVFGAFVIGGIALDEQYRSVIAASPKGGPVS